MANYAQNPDAPGAANALMPYAPELPINLQELGLKRAEIQRKATAEQNARRIGTRYTGGDRVGARNEAIETGNFELAKQFGALDEDTQKLVGEKYKTAAPVIVQAQQLPYAQRRSLIASAAPALMAGGWTQEELAGFDPTDEALAGLATSSMTVAQVLDRNSSKWVAEPGGGVFRTDWQGNPIGRGNPYASDRQALPTTPTGNGSMSAPDVRPNGSTFSFQRIPGDTETSGYRTPERNRAVGGVENSYHTKRDSAGNPLASDRVPPAGMSMGQFHAQLKRQNPDLDVINEGDHVHLEPKSRTQFAAGGSRTTGKVNAPKLVANARAAIAAGADPAQVKARLRSMGVDDNAL